MVEVTINNEKNEILHEKVLQYLKIIESIYKLKIKDDIIINYSNTNNKSAQNNFKRIEIPVINCDKTMAWITVHEIAHFLFGKLLKIENNSNLWIAEGGASFTADIVLLIAEIDSIEDLYKELQKSFLRFDSFVSTRNYYQLSLHGGRLMFHFLYYLEGGDSLIYLLQKIFKISNCNENAFLDINLLRTESINLINKFIQFEGFTKYVKKQKLLRKCKRQLERFTFIPFQKHIYESLLKIRTCLNTERFSLFLFDKKIYKSIFNEGVDFSFYFSKGQGICGQSVLHKKSIYTNLALYDKRSLCRYRDSTTAYKTESLLAFPIVKYGKVIAVYEVLNKKTDFNENDIIYIKKIFKKKKIKQKIVLLRRMVIHYGKDFF